MTPDEFLQLGHDDKVAAIAENPDMRALLPGMAAVSARMLTVRVANASESPAVGVAVTVTPQPADVEYVTGVSVILSTDAADPDVILADPIPATTNALGEASFLLVPSGGTVAADDGSQLTYRVHFGPASANRYVDSLTMPDADTRLKDALA